MGATGRRGERDTADCFFLHRMLMMHKVACLNVVSVFGAAPRVSTRLVFGCVPRVVGAKCLADRAQQHGTEEWSSAKEDHCSIDNGPGENHLPTDFGWRQIWGSVVVFVCNVLCKLNYG